MACDVRTMRQISRDRRVICMARRIAYFGLGTLSLHDSCGLFLLLRCVMEGRFRARTAACRVAPLAMQYPFHLMMFGQNASTGATRRPKVSGKTRQMAIAEQWKLLFT